MAADKAGFDPLFDPRFDPAFQPGFREAETGAVPRPEPRGGSRNDEATAIPSREFPDPAPLAGNPWVRVLWIVAIVFSLGGIAAMAWSETAQLERESAAAALILPVVVAGVAPWFVLTGLAAGVGVAILAAVRWRPGR